MCRHSQCDLHTTTNILLTDLADRCSVPFTPANLVSGAPATARCCTSDISQAEFRTLCGRQDVVNPAALTPEQYLHGGDDAPACGTCDACAFRLEAFQNCGVRDPIDYAERPDYAD